jgi:hypothetical protein
MVFRTAAVVAAVIVMALAGAPVVASTWLPSWLDEVVNGANSRTESSAEVSSRRVRTASAGHAQRTTKKLRRADRKETTRSTTSSTTANATRPHSPRCLSSAADVRKAQPKAWPKWTYGPAGERCWYAGAKPVFAKRSAPRPRFARRAPEPPPQAAPRPAVVAPESDGRNIESARRAPEPRAHEAPWPSRFAPEPHGRNTDSASHPWALEDRWRGGLQ